MRSKISKSEVLILKELRTKFNTLVKEGLGEDYYNSALDVYDSDTECCKQLLNKIKNPKLIDVFKGWVRKVK